MKKLGTLQHGRTSRNPNIAIHTSGGRIVIDEEQHNDDKNGRVCRTS